MLTIHEGTQGTVLELAMHLHPADTAELAAAGQRIEGALQGVRLAELRNGPELVCAFGVQPGPGYGVPWMLCTDAVDRVPRREMALLSRRVATRWKAEHDTLVNLVHAQNARAVRFVKWLGFTVEPEPVGPGGEFRAFWWKGRHV